MGGEAEAPDLWLARAIPALTIPFVASAAGGVGWAFGWTLEQTLIVGLAVLVLFVVALLWSLLFLLITADAERTLARPSTPVDTDTETCS